MALSWMWGLGLSFSVQFSLQYGLFGLLTFAIPNALGLMVFGGLTQLIAKRAGNGPDALGSFLPTGPVLIVWSFSFIRFWPSP